MVVEDGQSDRSFSNPAGTDESEWGEVFCEADDLINQFIAPEEGPWWSRRQFTGYGRFKDEIWDSLVV